MLTTGDEEGSAPSIAVVSESGEGLAEAARKRPAFPPEPPIAPGEEESLAPRSGFWRRHRLFIFTVVLPMAVAAGVLFSLAPRYSSTTTFIVRSTDPNPMNELFLHLAPELRTTTISLDDTYVINTYLNSRDLVDQLVKNDHLREVLSRPQADFIFRYPTFWLPDNKEFLFRRFQWMAKAEVDLVTNVSSIEVNAFTPKDAEALAIAMLGYSEAMVNRMNDRFYESQMATAERVVAEAQRNLDAAEAELKAFRSASGSFDPNLVAQSELNVIQGLTTQLAEVQTAIATNRALTTASPQLSGLRAQAQSYRDEIARRTLEMAGGPESEAVKLQSYDQLTLRRDLAVQALSDAVAQREETRQDAKRQHLFVQIVTPPSLSLDWARYPRITLNLLALLAICLAVFVVLRKLCDAALEHRS